MAKVIVQLESGRRREYELTAVNSVGRHPMQTIQVLDPQVSKEHLIIERQRGGRWVLRDLGSLNGTYLDGAMVNRPMELRHQNRVSLGNTQILFLDPEAVASGEHAVDVTDNVQTSIYGAEKLDAALEFLPADRIEDEETLRRDYEKLRLAGELHRAIALEYRQEKLLPRILDTLLGMFAADRGVILLAETPGAPLEPKAVRVKSGRAEGQSITLSRTILDKVLREQTALLTNDAQSDDRFSGSKSIILQGIRSTMCVPLLSRDGGVIGVIHLDSVCKPNAFSERDLQMLQGLAQTSAIAIENSRLVNRIEDEAVTRQKFEKMLSPNLVEQVVSGELQIEKGGQLRTLTVMFTDIRGFTTMTEEAPAQEIVKMLNEYFEALVDIVFQYNGTVDKFIGDGLMAFWGAPVQDPNGAPNSVGAAIEIQRQMKRFNALRRADGYPELHTGVGIATDELVVGHIGSSKTMSYTAVGPGVNLASRLCAVAKGGEILVGDETYRRCGRQYPADWREPLQLKGIRYPVPNWSIKVE